MKPWEPQFDDARAEYQARQYPGDLADVLDQVRNTSDTRRVKLGCNPRVESSGTVGVVARL